MPKATQVDFLLSGVSDNSGNVLSNGQVFFYVAGGGLSTPKSTWADSGKVTLNSSPVTLSSGGTANIYADGLYDIVIKDSAGTTVRTFLNLTFDTQTHTETHISTSIVGYTTGTVNNYSVTIADYKGGGTGVRALLIVSFHITNTLTSTLNVNGGGAQTIYRAIGVPLSAGDLQASAVKLLLNDGVNGYLLVS